MITYVMYTLKVEIKTYAERNEQKLSHNSSALLHRHRRQNWLWHGDEFQVFSEFYCTLSQNRTWHSVR